MDLDDLADLIIHHRCLCGGAGVIHLGDTPVPCPDCGDV